MRPGTLRAYALGVLTGSVMTSALFVWTASAKADVTDDEAELYSSAVCSTLADYPTTDGVLNIGLALKNEGFSDYEAGQIIGSAVINECPRFIPLMKRFVALYGGSQVA
jgi:hypothetical protein